MDCHIDQHMEPSGQLLTTGVNPLLAYLNGMGSRGRFIVVNSPSQNRTLGWATFFILESLAQVEEVQHRALWDTSYIDSNEGTVCYIDKAIVNEWNRAIRELFRKEIMQRFPAVHWVAWFRPSKSGPDRRVVKLIERE